MVTELVRPADGWRYCVAPMLDWTDRHCRYFHRAITKRARLYTEMITTGAILHGDRDKLLAFDGGEHPVALQLGGGDPDELARSVEIASAYGYDEFNLNCGCPSERVQKGAFGASLMLDAPLVARCVAAMQSVTDKPVTVKHRIGVDERDDSDFVLDFVGTVYEAGCRVFIVHTRSAWLKGLSPKENREIPPLRRERAMEVKRAFPLATVVANGQIADLDTAEALIASGLDGVMVGRAAYHDPWHMSRVDERLYGEPESGRTRADVVKLMHDYLEAHYAHDERAIRATTRHMMGLAQGLSGARRWRRFLSDPASFSPARPDVLTRAWEAAFGPDA